MKIFIFLNGFISRTLLFQLDYILNERLESIILLSENHSEEDVSFYYNNRNKIFIYDNIETCIEKCDTIVLENRVINPEIKKSKKRKVYISVPDRTEEVLKESIPLYDYSQKPVIAILSMGLYNDSYCTEILINKILNNIGALPLQLFSKRTSSLLENLEQEGILNPKLIKKPNEENSDIFVICIDCDGYTYSDFNSLISKISPDMLVLCTNYIFKNENEIRNFFHYIKEIDIIISSPYIPYEVNPGKYYAVFCKKNNINNSNSIIYNENLESILKETIFKKLYYSKDITIM